MAALAAIVDKDVADDKTICLFYNTSKAQLALSLQSGTDTDTDDPASDTCVTPDDYDRYILNPSSIAAAYYKGLKYVAAMTMPKQGQIDTDVQISLVSPTCQNFVEGDRENNHIALGITPDGNECWLYYLVDVSANVKAMRELDLSTNETQALSAITQVRNNSSIAAWYDPEEEKRHVIYEAGAILDYTVGAQNPDTLPISDFARNSSIGVAYSGSTKKAYLYYYDVYQNLKRSVHSGSNWGLPETISNAPMVAENSQITVAQANGFNHVFYIAKDMGTGGDEGQSSFTHIRDSIN
ncbi:hypothetical protein F5Y00DRAFT_273077 [Daldinia vernicosa]|uniref:uncharacterized protein n=1 Tax=Daldinia vernicosa TaxID=114800 RepID=UPI002008D1CF|nr:uncharacterized protein F5Y00DRAFT_273077 [Daldinia vernicosa]KAI0852452.1 hypothetical protein F5Y00DRAFT_273077 [Daldinia vernicosa]